jgi:hypothetical protein
MRYVTVRVTPAEGEAFHPIGQALADEPSITREAIHRVELLADGTGIMLGESRGDRDAYEAILAESDYVIEYAVTGAESRWYAYLHFEPTETTRSMIEQLRQSPVMLEMPVPADEDGAMLLTFVGDGEGFADAIPAAPDVYDVEVVETGERPPSLDDPLRLSHRSPAGDTGGRRRARLLREPAARDTRGRRRGRRRRAQHGRRTPPEDRTAGVLAVHRSLSPAQMRPAGFSPCSSTVRNRSPWASGRSSAVWIRSESHSSVA